MVVLIQALSPFEEEGIRSMLRIIGICLYVVTMVSVIVTGVSMAVRHPDSMLGINVPMMARWLEAQTAWMLPVLLVGMIGGILGIWALANIANPSTGRRI